MKTSVVGILGLAAMGLAPSIANADIVIEFSGMNLVYNGSALYDAGSAAGGNTNPADADGLASVDFFLNGSQVGAMSSDISLDVYIPNLVGIPSTPGTATIINTGGAGFFDLLMGTSPLASQYLLVDVSSVTVTYIDVAGIIQFTFGAAVADSFAQNLPYGLIVGQPLTVSFSAQIDPGTLTSAGGFITGFHASGTGEFRGLEIPTPGSIALVALGVPAVIRRRR
ncbi:MAG: hypothetical protein KJZ65_00295 [Phycisphaerales bacterium]|nr:hypothetical protein [Phycisphaerales bacterium]